MILITFVDILQHTPKKLITFLVFSVAYTVVWLLLFRTLFSIGYFGFQPPLDNVFFFKSLIFYC